MKKNAFTLIELIATIGLLGMLATITITVSVRKINKTKEKARDTMIESIELAAKKYVNDYGNEILEFNNYDNAYILLQTLVEKEYFTESLIDPTTKKSLPLTNEIYVTREESGEITSNYNINQRSVPKLTLIGSYNEYVEEGSEYVEKGVIAINPSKEDVSSNVITSGTVDTTIPNIYKIIYELDNVKITRNVIVFSKNISSEEFYKFTVNLDGGTDNIEYEKKYKAGSTIVLEEPTKEGYNFAGWTIKGKGSNINENILTTGPGIIMVTAIWEEQTQFEKDDWSTIVEAVKSKKYPYQVGNKRKINLGSNLGEHIIRVSNTSNCEEFVLASETACGFVLEFEDVIITYNMNKAGEYNGKQYINGTNLGGWPASAMRSYLNETIYNALPEDLKNAIIDTKVLSSHGSDDNDNFISTDKLYLLSPQEVYGISFTNSNDSSNGTSRQLDWYEQKGVSISKFLNAKKTKNKEEMYWGLRSSYLDNSSSFFRILTTGEISSSYSIRTFGISPAFRIG